MKTVRPLGGNGAGEGVVGALGPAGAQVPASPRQSRGHVSHSLEHRPRRLAGADAGIDRRVAVHRLAGCVRLPGLHNVMRSGKVKPAQIVDYARDTRIWSVLRPYLETVVADGA